MKKLILIYLAFFNIFTICCIKLYTMNNDDITNIDNITNIEFSIETTSNIETTIIEEPITEASSEAPTNDLGQYCYNDNDLYLLAKVIDAEASDACTDEHKMCTGQVILNRMNSDKYPDTLKEVVYEKGQYDSVENNRLKEEVSERSLNVAKRLLEGEKILDEDVIYQAEFPQGSEILKTIYNEYLNTTTYYCR